MGMNAMEMNAKVLLAHPMPSLEYMALMKQSALIFEIPSKRTLTLRTAENQRRSCF